MKANMIAGLVLAMSCGAASAQPNYEGYEARLKVCDNYGQLASVYWQLQRAGAKPDPTNHGYMEPVRAYIEKTIYTQPERYPTQIDADRMGSADCMDNIERLARDHKAGLN